MAAYYCSPRAHWFMDPLCTCSCSPLVGCRVHPFTGDATSGGDFIQAGPVKEIQPLSDEDIERIARRVAEILKGT